MKKNIIALSLLVTCLSAGSLLQASEHRKYKYQENVKNINRKYERSLKDAEDLKMENIIATYTMAVRKPEIRIVNVGI